MPFNFKLFNNAANNIISRNVGYAGNFVKGVGKHVGKSVIGTIANAPNIPLAPGVTIKQVAKSVTTGSVQDLTKSLGKFTGLKSLVTPPKGFADSSRFINDVIAEGTGINVKNQTKDIRNILKQPSLGKLKVSFAGENGVLKQMISQQISGCIEAKINKLRNYLLDKGIPGIPGIPGLNPDLVIRQKIGEFRLEIVRTIRKKLEVFKHQKIQLHQTAIFRQRIQKTIRSMCDAPASTNRRYQLDTILKKSKELTAAGDQKRKFRFKLGTEKVVDADTDILQRFSNSKVYGNEYIDIEEEEIKMKGFKKASTDAATNNAYVKLEKESIKQSEGYHSTTILEFIDSEGVIA